MKFKSIKKAIRKVHHVRQKLGFTRKRLFGNGVAGVSLLQSPRPTSASTQARSISNLVRSL